MPRRASLWSYIAGEKGRNRVRAFERASGMLHLEYMDDGQRRSTALGHRDRARGLLYLIVVIAGLLVFFALYRA